MEVSLLDSMDKHETMYQGKDRLSNNDFSPPLPPSLPPSLPSSLPPFLPLFPS